ncbi:hypothetical protein SPRG_07124 [Saprolegnia parasitica CBS 223.65]|uniref:E3 ubiquitin-protein ligase n=1 Tax=Saprolegnia parasitica (strain CBS 223.65) TaxID=695850 RepID=A0A067CMT8_SAPPC|nr:hypothetical protein SPRG_07124 [Saprolegnia parasitica CBS 223.65]KDO27851.1 hypothetical protein SPRG_07124 [Saprolegnia parasitica CBS 223.65]|eukprot:XP_012201311.1 hypothetical protein SPRG_07124 [Saprolegnia parasitica CBS 223.65]
MTTATLASPTALAQHVTAQLADASAVDVLPPGWLQRFVDEGFKPASLPAYFEASLLAAVHASGATQYDSAETYLHDLHDAHAKTVPKRVCGYMFKHNDIAWNCRDCQMDDTCVLCQTCFQRSDHTGHQVFFHRTSPGGMCDCGDEEAWKPSGFCPQHQGHATGTDLPPALPSAIARVVQALASEVVGLLTLVAHRSVASFDDELVAHAAEATRQQHLRQFPTDLRPKLFHVRVSNDDVHTDEELIVSLQKKGFTAVFAQTFTHSVDKAGAGSLRRHETFADALALMRVLLAENWFVSIVDDVHEALEEVATAALGTLLSLTAVSPSVLHTLLLALFAPVQANYADSHDDYRPIRVLLQATPFLKKPLMRHLSLLYLKLMGDRDRKLEFALVYARVYSKLALQYFCGKGTNKEALFGLGVQLFTTPSIVHALVHDHAFLDTILLSLQSGLELALDHAATMDMGHMVVRYRRYQPLIMDLNHILVIPHMAAAFGSHETLETYVAMLRMLGGMNMQVRVPEARHHVDHVDDRAWIGAFNLHLTVAAMPPALFKGLRLLPLDVFQNVLQTLLTTIHAALPVSTDAHVGGVDSSPVSFHYPLHHLLSRVILEHLSLPDVAPLDHLLPPAKVAAMLEPPLRTLVWASQIASQLWVRNGNDLMIRQLTSYYNIGYNLSFRDLDVALVQASVVVLGHSCFMSAFLRQYDLNGHWLVAAGPEKCRLYVADCLLKLLWLVTELPPPATQPIEVLLRREVVHFLSYQPFLYSALREQTEPLYARPGLESVSDDAKNKQLMAVLHDVADMSSTTPNDLTPPKFSLKPALYSEYDPCFIHVSPMNHVKAQVARQDALFKTWTPSSPCIPMVQALPPCHASMQHCRDLVLSHDVFALLRLCLADASDESVLSRLVHVVTVQLLVVTASTADGVWDELRCPDNNHVPSSVVAETASTVRDSLDAAIKASAMDEGADVARSSLLAALAEKAMAFRDTLEASTKPLLSALLFVLQRIQTLCPRSATFLNRTVFPPATNSHAPMDPKARLALQKLKQQQAMAAMQARQSQFATMLDDDDSGSDKDDDAMGQTTSVQAAPECIICAQVKKDEPVMFIGLAQTVPSLTRHRFDPIAPTIHVSLCGHALHLPCAQQYLSTVARDVGASLLQQHAIAFDASMGEFLCPLCKGLSNSIVPFVPRPNTAPTSLESYFQGAMQPDKITDFLQSHLPSQLVSAPPMETVANAFEGLAAYLHSLRNLRPVNLANPVSIVRIVLDSVSQAFETAQLRGLSVALQTLAYDADALPLSLAHRLGVGLPLDAESALDPFTPRDDAKLHAMLLLLRRLPVMMPASTFHDVVPTALAAALSGDAELVTDAAFATRVASGMLPSLGLPLLSHDLFGSLLLTCSVLRDKADMLWAIRGFGCLAIVQALLQCLEPVDDLVEADDGQTTTVTPVTAWRHSIADVLGVSVAPTAPSGDLLHLAFETTVLSFLRKATLLARAIFRGPDDDDAGLYLNFVNHLQLSTSLHGMCQQLGVPLPADLLAATSFTHYLHAQLKRVTTVVSPHAWKHPNDAPIVDATAANLAALPRLALRRHDRSLWAAHVALTPLARRYTDLYAVNGAHLCPKTGLPQESTALCMRCGVAVCAGTDCCKRSGRGACFQHVEHCGHGNGAFFLLKACSMLLVSVHGRACFFTSPYVDEFGEEDIYVKRGRPLHLRPKRLLALLQHLSGHSVAPEVSKVRRTSDQYIRAYFY